MKLLNVEREFPTPLLAFFRRRLAKFHDAEDLVQDVLLRLAQRDAPDHIRNVKGYVFQVAANRLSDYQKCEASRKQGNLLDISHFLMRHARMRQIGRQNYGIYNDPRTYGLEARFRL